MFPPNDLRLLYKQTDKQKNKQTNKQNKCQFKYKVETFNPIKCYKISQKLSPKHAARGVAQSPYPIYRHGKACLSKQSPWRAAGNPRLARGRSWV